MERGYVFKMGFALDTPEDEATRQALDAAEEYCRESHCVSDGATAQVVRSPELEEAGQFMVRIDGQMRSSER